MMKRLILILWLSLPGMAWAEETPLTLDEAIQLALKQNRQLQSSRDRITSATFALEAAQSEFKIKLQPQLSGLFQEGSDVNQQYGLHLSKKLTFGGELSGQVQTRVADDDKDRYQTNVTLSYTQPLLKGRGTLPTTADLVSAERSVQSQERALILAQQQLMISVATAYYGILRDNLLREVNLRALERAMTLLEATEAKLNVGMASKMDVFRAEMQTLSAQNGLLDAKASAEQTRRQFNLLLGAALAAEFSLTTPLAYEPVELNPEALLQQALENRLEFLDAAENISAAERRMAIARQNQYPPFNLSIQYTLSGKDDAFGNSFELDEQRWGMGVSSSFTVNTAQEQAAYQQAQMAYDETLWALQSLEQDIQLDVLQTIASVQQAQTRVMLQEQSVTQAEKQWELAELRYKKGLSDNLDLIDAEEALISAKSSYYSAVMQHTLAKMQLKQAAGTIDVPALIPNQ